MFIRCRQEKHGQIVLPHLSGIPDGRTSEELCASAASMANNLGARALFCYTRRCVTSRLMTFPD